MVPMTRREPLTTVILFDRLQRVEQLPDANVDDAVVPRIGESQNRGGSRRTDAMQACEQLEPYFFVPRGENPPARILDDASRIALTESDGARTLPATNVEKLSARELAVVLNMPESFDDLGGRWILLGDR